MTALLTTGGAAFTLPLPLDAMATIVECVERVYGTGDARMSMQGDQLQIIAPENGWGPRRRGRGALPSASHEAMRLRWLAIRDHTVEVTIDDQQYAVLLVSEIARQWFESVGGVNYVETKLLYGDATEPEFVFTMQRIDGLTPADKLDAAERRIAELEQIITDQARTQETT